MDTTFCGFLQRRNAITTCAEKDSALSEVSEYFPREGINALFHQEIEKLLARPSLPVKNREELESLLDFDAVAYLDRSLRRAGFRDPELDLLVQDLAVKLLVTGNLFSGWTGEGSFKARFLVSLRHAIATQVVRRNRHRTRRHELAADTEARPLQPTDDLIDEFRDYLKSQLGMVAVSVFDHRLAGQDTKALIGSQGMTSYRLKKIVADIKDAATRFAGRDPDFRNMVQRAFEREASTMERRFKRVGI